MNWLARSILIASAILLTAQSPQPTPVPSPRETAKDAGQAANQTENSAKASNKIPNKAAIQDKIDTLKQEPHGYQITAQNKHEAEAIRVAPVDLNKDWLDYSFVVFSCLLVVIGFLQAKLLKQSFRADRPYLLFEKADLFGFRPPKDMSTAEMLKADPAAKLIFKNYGKGPALIQGIMLKLKAVSELPSPRDFTECIRCQARLDAVTPQGDFIVHTDFIDSASMSFEDIEAVHNRSKTLIVYGYVKYTDVFGNPYETGIFLIGLSLDTLRAIGFAVPDPFLSRDRTDPADKERNYYK